MVNEFFRMTWKSFWMLLICHTWLLPCHYLICLCALITHQTGPALCEMGQETAW